MPPVQTNGWWAAQRLPRPSYGKALATRTLATLGKGKRKTGEGTLAEDTALLLFENAPRELQVAINVAHMA